MDRLTALTVFRHTVELGSFAAAAKQLRLSPAAISKNIGELEAHLAVRLLNRTTRSMSVTEAGSAYYDRVVRILEDLEEADGTLGAMQNEPKGILRVTAPMTVTLTCLSHVIPKFLTRYPDLTLDLQLNDRRVNMIEEGFDVAIRGSDNLEDSGLIARKLMTMRHVVCSAPSYFERCGVPRSPSELKHHTCVQFSLSDHAQEWTFERRSRTVRVPVNGPYKVSSSLAVRDALREGYGLSLIPWVYVKEDLESGKLVTVLDDWTPDDTTVYAVYPSKCYVVSKVRAFLEFLIDEFEQGVYQKQS